MLIQAHNYCQKSIYYSFGGPIKMSLSHKDPPEWKGSKHAGEIVLCCPNLPVPGFWWEVFANMSKLELTLMFTYQSSMAIVSVFYYYYNLPYISILKQQKPLISCLFRWEVQEQGSSFGSSALESQTEIKSVGWTMFLSRCSEDKSPELVQVEEQIQFMWL